METGNGWLTITGCIGLMLCSLAATVGLILQSYDLPTYTAILAGLVTTWGPIIGIGARRALGKL